MVNTTNDVKRAGITDAQIDELAEKFGKELKGSQKVKVTIPVVDGEDKVLECGINGYTYILPRGIELELPKPIVEILKNADAI